MTVMCHIAGTTTQGTTDGIYEAVPVGRVAYCWVFVARGFAITHIVDAEDVVERACAGSLVG